MRPLLVTNGTQQAKECYSLSYPGAPATRGAGATLVTSSRYLWMGSHASRMILVIRNSDTSGNGMHSLNGQLYHE